MNQYNNAICKSQDANPYPDTANELEYGEITGYKCGELFVSQRGIFYLNCHFCDKTFFELNYFAKHFLEEHNFDVQESTIQKDNTVVYDEPQTPIENDNDNEQQEMQQEPEQLCPEISLSDDSDSEPDNNINILEEDDIQMEEPQPAVQVEKIADMFETKHLIPDYFEQQHQMPLREINEINIKEEVVIETREEKEDIETEIIYPKYEYDPNNLNYPNILPDGKVSCGICGKIFTVSGLRVHMNKHPELFKCDAVDCKERFINQSDLEEHVVKDHRNNLVYPFQCSVCYKLFRLKIRLQQHFRRFHMREKNFKCHFCDKCFFLKNELKNHETFHTGIKGYVCEKCGKTFAVRQRLVTHMKAVHPNGSIFPCTQCEKKFYHSDILKRHMECHTEARPFDCNLCSKGFKRKHSLKSHMDSVHNQESDKNKNHFCDICGRGFMQKRNLSFHKKSHWQ